MNTRPKAEEDEDDLLKLQAQFLQGNNAPTSASIRRPDKRPGQTDNTTRDVVKMDVSEESTGNLHSIPAKKSKFQQEQDPESRLAEESIKGGSLENDDIENMMDRKDTGLAAVLTSIIERDTRNEMVSAPLLTGQGFPQVVQNDKIGQQTPVLESGLSQGRRKKKSLFAQHVEAKSAQHFGIPQSNIPRKAEMLKCYPSSYSGSISQRSHIVEGKGLSVSNSLSESQSIHTENVHKLSSMSESEILEEQRKLLESMDPKILEFLRSKRLKHADEENKAEQEMEGLSSINLNINKQKIEKNTKPDLNPLLQSSNEWLHMGVVEKEKMEWMTDLPPPDSISSQTGKSARFDFDGDILPVDADIPVNCGLHHHGDEPERAGYTIQELFTLARSANLQQRILALHTIAKIIRMAKSGSLKHKIAGPLISALLDGGILILIRLSLDDTAEGVVFAAVDALNSLVCHPLDQEAVSSTWVYHLGNILPSLIPAQTAHKLSEPEDLDEENQEQETDADMVKRDVILALVTRMQLLNRFHFILENMRPQALIVTSMMEILASVAQHSSNMAYEITKHTRLLNKIIKEFLPTAWSPQDLDEAVSNVYGLPVPSALRMVRCLCQAGRHITATLIAKNHLQSILLRYLAVDTRSLHLPNLESFKLQMEALAVWRVCATYGFGLQIFFDLYPQIVMTVSKFEDSWSKSVLTTSVDSNSCMKEAYLVNVLERILYIIRKQEAQHGHQDSQQSEILGPQINWSHVRSLYQPIRACVHLILKAIGQNYPSEKHNLAMPTTCINFIASFYEMERRQTEIDVTSRGEDLENFCQDCLSPFLLSLGFSVLADNLCPYSNLLLSPNSSVEESTPNLPSMCVCWDFCQESNTIDNDNDVKMLNMPVLRENSPFGFIVSLLRLSLNICRRHKALIEKVISPLVNNASIISYMRKVCQTSDSAFTLSFWTRTENMLQYYWLKCCQLIPCIDMTLAHRVALSLLCRLQGGDEFIAHDLFSSTIFSPFFIKEGEEIQLASQALANMSLSENLYMKSATQEEINVSKSQQLKEAFSSLATIRGHFLMALGGMEKAVMHSRNIHCGNPSEVQFQLLPGIGESLMPKDWMYLPLIHVYNKANQIKTVCGTNISSQDIAMMTSVLQWNYMYEVWRPREIDHVSITTKVSRVMCAFLAGNDMFLEKRVQTFLAGLLREFACPRFLNALNFEEKVPGISSFYDLYQDFLDHYESVSFGDPVFGLYVLLPLQQKHSSLYRKAVWGERRKLLRTLRISFHDCLIPVENFLESEEDDVELIQLYLHALVTQSVQSAWSPIMFLVAVHHLNRFLFVTFDDGKQTVRDKIWSAILDNCETMSPVINYKKFNVTASQGLELYDGLPDNRKIVLNNQMSKKGFS